jgi:hypothetical protein
MRTEPTAEKRRLTLQMIIKIFITSQEIPEYFAIYPDEVIFDRVMRKDQGIESRKHECLDSHATAPQPFSD